MLLKKFLMHYRKQQKIDLSDEKLISNLKRKKCFEWQHNAGYHYLCMCVLRWFKCFYVHIYVIFSNYRYALYPQSQRLILVHQINFSNPCFSAFVFLDFKDIKMTRYECIISLCFYYNLYI